MSWLSSFAHFAFDPVKAAAARATTSSSPVAQATGNAALAAVATIATDIGQGLQSHNSAIGIINTVVGDAETALKGLVDSYVEATVGGLPLVGGLLAPQAVGIANNALDFGEQHLLTYISALFSHHSAAVNSTPIPAPLPQ